MSDEGEKTCPLCAEEMDLTDQQLKPCKCGYEICVWCWHHIMDMAEKDDSEGRCPACRSLYDKEKIVGMAASCERVVSEVSFEKKKTQKMKIKPSDGRKQLNSVRVIQRNLVYIVGLPLTLADEDLLQQREYFGQYGKVLKVSMSRTASGVIQQFPNSTCSVYITYTKEEEAVRCIQSVHGFLLDGRVLKACFGTTKYCHAWLRNMPCTNPDCLYLHEVGSQEDSFTKDEIISAYTRNRVQQITGTMTNTLRRVGNVLPPPIDDYSAPPSEKPISRSASQNLTVTEKNSPPTESSGRSVGLPAAASWGMRSSSSVGQSLSIAPTKQKHDHSLLPAPLPSPAMLSILQNDRIKSPTWNEDQGKKDTSHIKHNSSAEDHSSVKPSSEIDPDPSEIISSQFSTLSFKSKDSTCNSILPSNPCSEETDRNLPSDLVSDGPNYPNGCYASSRVHSIGESSSSTDVGQLCSDRTPSVGSVNGVCSSTNQMGWTAAIDAEAEEDVISFDNQRLKDPEIVTRSSYLPNSYGSFTSNTRPPLISDAFSTDAAVSNPYNRRNPSNGYSQPNNTSGRTMIQNNRNRSLDMGESSIISDILSLDVDPWDESLTSPHNLVKFLSEPEKQPPIKLPNSRTSAQSRFSFARQDSAAAKQLFGVEASRSNSFYSRIQTQDSYLDKYLNPSSFDDSSTFAPSSLNKPSQGPTRVQVSAPPGFSVPNRAPPPGFTSHDQSFDFLPGNSMHDMVFVDPAILAVGKGRLQGGYNASSSHYQPQFSSYENEARLQMLMQRSRYADESMSPDSFGVSARFAENPQVSQFSQLPRGVGSNQQWDGGNNIAELLRNERFGVNNFYGDFYNRSFDM